MTAEYAEAFMGYIERDSTFSSDSCPYTPGSVAADRWRKGYADVVLLAGDVAGTPEAQAEVFDALPAALQTAWRTFFTGPPRPEMVSPIDRHAEDQARPSHEAEVAVMETLVADLAKLNEAVGVVGSRFKEYEARLTRASAHLREAATLVAVCHENARRTHAERT